MISYSVHSLAVNPWSMYWRSVIYMRTDEPRMQVYICPDTTAVKINQLTLQCHPWCTALTTNHHMPLVSVHYMDVN